jgi:uncharacterized protein
MEYSSNLKKNIKHIENLLNVKVDINNIYVKNILGNDFNHKSKIYVEKIEYLGQLDKLEDANGDLEYNKRTLLHFAVENNDYTFLNYLLKLGVNINSVDCYSCTPLYYAIDDKNYFITAHLLKYKADPNKDKQSLLSYAINRNSNKIVYALMDAKVDINKQDKYKNTPINYALRQSIKHKKNNYFVHLISLKADLNVYNKQNTCTLSYSLYKESTVHMKILLNSKANIDDNCLYECINHSSYECLKVLVNHKANVDTINNNALNYAIDRSKKHVKLLINAKANINKVDWMGESSFIHAIKHSNKNIIELLINNKANVNKTSILGRTPLMYSIIHNKIKYIDILINAKTDLNIIDAYQKTALDYAFSEKLKKLISKFTKLIESGENGKNDKTEKTIIVGNWKKRKRI